MQSNTSIGSFSEPDMLMNLWQLDLKGPLRVQGRKYWFLICTDNYSRYMLLAKQFGYEPKVEEIEQILEPLVKKHKPKKISIDNKPFLNEIETYLNK